MQCFSDKNELEVQKDYFYVYFHRILCMQCEIKFCFITFVLSSTTTYDPASNFRFLKQNSSCVKEHLI